MTDSKDKAERALDNVIGIFAHEGITLDSEQIARCKAVLSGEADSDDLVNELFAKHRKDSKEDGSNS